MKKKTGWGIALILLAFIILGLVAFMNRDIDVEVPNEINNHEEENADEIELVEEDQEDGWFDVLEDGSGDVIIKGEIFDRYSYVSRDYGFYVEYPTDWSAGTGEFPSFFVFEEGEGVWPAKFTIDALLPNGMNVEEYREKELSDGDILREQCLEESNNEAPCLYERDLVEREYKAEFNDMKAIKVEYFAFDHTRECVYVKNELPIHSSKMSYIYKICHEGGRENPNNPQFERHQKMYRAILESLEFQKI